MLCVSRVTVQVLRHRQLRRFLGGDKLEKDACSNFDQWKQTELQSDDTPSLLQEQYEYISS